MQISHISSQDIKDLSRKQRHDFMNTLQLIYGYLQLGKQEKAIEEIKKATAVSQYISQLHKISVLDISLSLEKIIIELINLGITLSIKVETPYEDECREIKNNMDIIEKITSITNYLLQFNTEEFQMGTINSDVVIIEKESSMDIVFLKQDFHGDDILEQIQTTCEDVEICDDNIIIKYKFEEVKNIKIKNSIYSKIYPNNI